MGITKQLVGVREMASALGVSPSWLRLKVYAGEVPHYRLGKNLRFDPDEVFDTLRKKRSLSPRNWRK